MADNQWKVVGTEPINPPQPQAENPSSGWQVVGEGPLENQKPSLLQRAWGALNYPLGHLLPGWEKESQSLTQGANEEAVKAGQTMDQRSNSFFPSVSDLHLLKGTALATERDLPDALATPLSIATMGLGGLAAKDLGMLSKVINPAARIAGGAAIGQGGYDLVKTRHESLLDPAADLQRANDLLNVVMGTSGEVAAQRAGNAARDIKAGRYSQPAPEEGIKPGVEPEPEVERQAVEPEQDWKVVGTEPLAPEKVADVRQRTEQQLPGFAEKPPAEKQALVEADVQNNVEQAAKLQAFAKQTAPEVMSAANPALVDAEAQIRNSVGRLSKIQKVLSAGDEADLSDKSMKDATGRVLQDMLDRHFSETERQDYQKARGRTSRAKALTSSEEQAKAAAMPETAPAGAELEQYIADNNLEQEVRQETVKRFMAEQPAGTKGLNREALRAFATENRRQIMEAVAARHAEVSKLSAAPSAAERAKAAEEAAKGGELSIPRSEEAAGMVRAEGMTAEDARTIVRNTRLNAFKREGIYYRNALKRVLVPQWAEALREGGESTFTPEELKSYPAEIRNLLTKELNAKKSAAAAPTEESVRPVVPQPAEAAPAPTQAAAEPAAGAQEGVGVEPFDAKKAASALALAKTGQPFETTLLRGSGRADRGSVYGEGAVSQMPILGEGKYSTPVEEHAKSFGPNVEATSVRLKNPLVIDNDAQWRALTKKAGWEFSNPVRFDPAKAGLQAQEIANMRTMLEKQGFDGVVVNVPENEAEGKLMQKVFGESQVIEFNKPQAQTPPQTPAQALPKSIAAPPGTAQATPPAAGLPPVPPPKPPAPTTPPPGQPGQPYDLERLITEIGQHPEVKRSMLDRLQVPVKNAAVEWASLKNKMSQAYTLVKWGAANAWESYRHPLDWSDFDAAIGHYSGNNQVLADSLRRFVKTIMPRTDALTREGMANYLDMGGDRQKLQNALANTSNEKLRAGYDKALNLTPEQTAMLDKIHQFQEWERDEAMKAGVLNSAVQDYIMHIWERPNVATDRIMANLNYGELQVNPTFARKRVFDTFFEGEQKGFTPAKKDVGFLIAAHHMSFGRAVSARAFIREMSGGNGRDGRPYLAVSGVGIPVQDPVSGAENYLIRPNALRAIPATTSGPAQTQALLQGGKLFLDANGKPKIDVSDFMTIDHPALRAWKWVAKAEDGNVMLQGDLKVHPEVYQKLKNILSRSAISSNKFGRAILSVSSTAKQTLLTLSAFHQVQEAVHAAGHGVNPFAPAKLDLSDAVQRFLVDHGLMVSDFGAMQDFSEGIASTGLLKYVPFLGEYMHAYQDYLFRDYIPRLKMDMAQKAFARNTQRFAGKMSREQIAALTARQANAAFGGLNYKLLGRNPTLQDVMRLTLLAPDFMEARTRFAAQALTPTGTEQLHALLKIAGVQYIGARILNYMVNNGDPKMDPQDAFRLVVGNTSYQLRSIPGDIADSLDDTRRFVQHRANPLTVRPLVELFTGRDEFGRTRTASDMALDYARNIAPIPLQGPIKKGDQDLADTIWTSLGVQARQHHTSAEQLALNYLQTKPFSGNDDPATFEKQRAFAKLREGLQDGSVSWDKVFELAQAGKLTSSQVSNLSRTVDMTNLQRWTRALEVPQAMDVFRQASANEQEQLLPMLQQKIVTRVQDPDLQDKYLQQLDALHARTVNHPFLAGIAARF